MSQAALCSACEWGGMLVHGGYFSVPPPDQGSKTVVWCVDMHCLVWVIHESRQGLFFFVRLGLPLRADARHGDSRYRAGLEHRSRF